MKRPFLLLAFVPLLLMDARAPRAPAPSFAVVQNRPPASAQARGTACIRGRVVMRATGAALPRATVRVQSFAFSGPDPLHRAAD
jgi:hypothetical protein